MSWTPSFSASSLSTETPVLPNGIYAGKLVNVAITGKENKQYFSIRKAQQWDKDAKAMVDVIENGEPKYQISGMVLVQAALISKKAQKLLARDEPQFLKMYNINFTDSFQPDTERNQQFANFLVTLGLDKEPFEDYVTFDYDADIEVPEEIAHVPNVIDMLNALNYYKELFTIICNAAKDQNVKVSIEKITKQDKSVVNEISGGRGGACGFLKYETGCEDDYVEA